MAHRRGNLEGNIRKRADGRWEARLSLPGGRRKSLFAKTRREVGQRLLQAQRAIAEGLPVAGERQTIGALLEAWLRDSAAHKVRPKTLRRYQEIVRLHLGPEIGRIRLARLTPQHVEGMLSSVAGKGVSPRTVAHCRAVLRNALNHAMRIGLVGRNVASLADAPHVPEREVLALTSEDARRILAAVAGDRLEGLFTVALACGLRQSEALGLRWGDVDLEGGKLTVQRTIQRVNGKYEFFEPKTARSRRTLALPAPLRQHRSRQTEERLRIGPAWESDRWGDLVFTDERGFPLSSFHVSRRFRKLLEVAGVAGMRYHDLRHASASLMAAQGVPARVAMEDTGTRPDQHHHEHLCPRRPGHTKGGC